MESNQAGFLILFKVNQQSILTEIHRSVTPYSFLNSLKTIKVLASLRKLQAMELNQHERHCVQLHFDFLQLQSHLITENASFTSSKFRLVECINLGIFYKHFNGSARSGTKTIGQ